jgi:prophage antirepressor-like protein
MDVQIFKSPEDSQIRTVRINGEPWFVASDICNALEIGNPSQARTRLESDEYQTLDVGAISNDTQHLVVSESGLYSLILGSRKPEAKEFKRWVTKEVLPSIRKTGSYGLPATFAEALQLAADQARAIEAKDAKIAQDAPKVEYYENFQESHGNFAISDVAKVMGYSRMEFFTILREKKIIFKRAGKWLPYQEFVSKGYFSVKVGATEETAWKQTRITPKGKTYIASIVPPGPMLHVPSVVDIFAP